MPLKKSRLWEYLERQVGAMRKIIFLSTLALSLGACAEGPQIASGPYLAVKCGINPRNARSARKFVFDRNNGSLYYFDLLTDTFKPLTRRVEQGIYFNSLEELSSRLQGKKLIINQIEYLDKESERRNIIKRTINLRSLVMYTVYEKPDGTLLRAKEDCVWIDPKLS